MMHLQQWLTAEARHEYVQHPCDEESQQQIGSHLTDYIQ